MRAVFIAHFVAFAVAIMHKIVSSTLFFVISTATLAYMTIEQNSDSALYRRLTSVSYRSPYSSEIWKKNLLLKLNEIKIPH